MSRPYWRTRAGAEIAGEWALVDVKPGRKGAQSTLVVAPHSTFARDVSAIKRQAIADAEGEGPRADNARFMLGLIDELQDALDKRSFTWFGWFAMQLGAARMSRDLGLKYGPRILGGGRAMKGKAAQKRQRYLDAVCVLWKDDMDAACKVVVGAVARKFKTYTKAVYRALPRGAETAARDLFVCISPRGVPRSEHYFPSEGASCVWGCGTKQALS